jgi:non-homologous end joining protein Ku
MPNTIDLMAALKASLEAAKKGKPAAAESAPAVKGKGKAKGKVEPDETEELAVAF